MAVGIVGVQDRPVAVRELTPPDRLTRAGQRANLVHLIQAPLPAFADQCLDEHRRGCRVVVLQNWNLIGDDMGIWHGVYITFSRQPHKRSNTSVRARRRSPTAPWPRTPASRGRLR